MAATVRDWQAHGVTLKVELATSGSLVSTGEQTFFPFASGGSGGAPNGWTAGEIPTPGSNTSLYNFTTAQGVASVSVKAVPTVQKSAGFWSPSFAIEPGAMYQIGCEARQMDGKAVSNRSVYMDRSNTNGTSWTFAMGTQVWPAYTGGEWEDILDGTSQPIPAGYTLGRLFVGGTCPADQLGLWGVQFRNLFIRKVVAPEAITWVDVTCDVQTLGVRYGRERFTNRYDVSALQLDLLNDEGTYSYHEPHPLNLAPGRQVRVTATYKGVTYPMAFHVIDSMIDAYGLDGHIVSRWSLVDPTAFLSNSKVFSDQSVQYKPGQRIGILLNQVGYVPRLLDAGTWNCLGIQSSGRSVRDEAGVTADSVGGNFFADREGNCVYKDRDWLTTDPRLTNVQANLIASSHENRDNLPQVDPIPTDPLAPTVCVNELATDWSLARVINTVSLANEGGEVRDYVDSDSVLKYGPQTYQRHDFILLDSDHLDTRAQDIMGGYSKAVLRVNSTSFAPGMSDAWEFTLGVFLNWLVRVWFTHPIHAWGYAVCSHIQSIEHRITPTDWLTTVTVDQPSSYSETIWASGVGWDEGVWDVNLWDEQPSHF